MQSYKSLQDRKDLLRPLTVDLCVTVGMKAYSAERHSKQKVDALKDKSFGLAPLKKSLNWRFDDARIK